MRGGGRGVAGSAPIEVEVGSRADAAPAADPFGLDLALRDRVKPAFRFLYERYWRVSLTGAHHLPASGPAIMVANHSGAVPFDGAMLVTAVDAVCGRPLRFLYDRFVDGMGPVATFYRKVGGAAATRENAIALLQAGELLLLFPEGVSGVAKPFGDRYRLQTFSPGFARLALALDVPIVPVAVVGAEEIYPLVGRAEGMGRLLGAPYVPITPFFPLLGLLGTVPLPTKWFIRIGRPLRLPGAGAAAVRDEPRWAEAKRAASAVRRRIQAMVTRLKRQRQSVFFG